MNAFKNRSIFWKYFRMMITFLILLLVAQILSNRILMKTITEKNLQEAESVLALNCERLSAEWFSINDLPEIIEDTQQYTLISLLQENAVPSKYITAPLFIREDLMRYSKYLGDYEEFAISFPNINTITSRWHALDTTEQYFSEHISFADSDPEEVRDLLNRKGTFAVLPAQEIRIMLRNNREAVQALAVIAHPLYCRTGIMIIYSEQTVMKAIGADVFPEGTQILLSHNGTVLSSYPDADTETGDYYELKGSLSRQEIGVTVRVPKNAYTFLLRSSMRTTWLMTLLYAVFGFILCIMFSHLSTEPLRRLVTEYRDQKKGPYSNELISLGYILQKNKNSVSRLSEMLGESQLARLFAGGVLMEREKVHLTEDLGFSAPYRIALVRFPDGEEHVRAQKLLGEALPENCRMTFVSRTETGILFGAEEMTAAVLSEVIEDTERKLRAEGKGLRCGVSGSFLSLDEFSAGLREARLAMPDTAGIGVYAAENTEAVPSHVSWSKHEQFYQSILTGNEEAASSLLAQIALGTGEKYGQFVFSDLLFVILGAAEDVGIHIADLQFPEYDAKMSGRENILGIGKPLRRLFGLMNEKKMDQQAGQRNRVLTYLKENCGDSSLNAASVSEALQQKEKEIGDTVRKMTGLSFSDYLTYLRMQKADQLLLGTDLAIEEVQIRCGYPASSTFYRLFRQYYGCSPKKYREENRGLRKTKDTPEIVNNEQKQGE